MMCEYRIGFTINKRKNYDANIYIDLYSGHNNYSSLQQPKNKKKFKRKVTSTYQKQQQASSEGTSKSNRLHVQTIIYDTHIIPKLVLFLGLDKIVGNATGHGSRNQQRHQNQDARRLHALGIIFHFQLFGGRDDRAAVVGGTVVILGKVAPAVIVAVIQDFWLDNGWILFHGRWTCSVRNVLGGHHGD